MTIKTIDTSVVTAVMPGKLKTMDVAVDCIRAILEAAPAVKPEQADHSENMLGMMPEPVECEPVGWINAFEQVPLESDGEVFVKFTDGSIGTGWATYWHGASNEFACWTLPDPDEDRTVEFWAKQPLDAKTRAMVINLCKQIREHVHAWSLLSDAKKILEKLGAE